MIITSSVDGVRQEVRRLQREGARVGFVPTMGALHAGHLTLVEEARRAGATRVVASVFVNPTQFGPGEDLDAYPRDPEGDAEKLRSVGTDVLFLPPVAVMYPPGAETRVTLERLPQHLCGLSRPHHFGGVATVVTGLLNVVGPDLAVFGEKDFQQLQVVRRLVRDLHMPVQVVGGPIVREADGLAMSSRNAYLSPSERARAVCLHQALTDAAEAVAAGERGAAALEAAMRSRCAAAGGEVEYAVVVDPDTLDALSEVGPSGARALLAVRFGRTRLIDNAPLRPPDGARAARP